MSVHGLWRGRATLCNGRTVVTPMAQQYPLKVAKAFAQANGGASICLMEASPGLFNGDVQEVDCQVEPGAALHVRTQSSCKIHPGVVETPSQQRVTLSVAAKGLLSYLPGPLVPFAGASHDSETMIHLQAGAVCVLGEVLTPGRVGYGEVFAYERVSSRVSVFLKGQLVARDALMLTGKSLQRGGAAQSLGGFTHLGTLWILSPSVNAQVVTALQNALKTGLSQDEFPVQTNPGVKDSLLNAESSETTEFTPAMYTGCSLLAASGMVVRILGLSAESLHRRMTEVLVWLERRGVVAEVFPNKYPCR